jgi:hypothetical protein
MISLDQETVQPGTPRLPTGKLDDGFFEPLPKEKLQQRELSISLIPA